MARQMSFDLRFHRRIGVNGKVDFDILARGDPEQCRADLIDVGYRLTAMRGHQHELAPVVAQRRPARLDDLESIDPGIAGDNDAEAPCQISCRLFARREQQRRKHVDRAPVALFGPRRQRVAGAQAGLDMADWQTEPVRGARGGPRAVGIALYEYEIGPQLGEQCADAPLRLPRKPGAVVGQRQVDVGGEAELR